MTGTLHFLDNASTTACLPGAAELVRQFSVEQYGHPSSTHALGQVAARAIREARIFFSELFQVSPEQVIFTGSGTEADNLAVYGVVLPALLGSKKTDAKLAVLASATEHPAIKKTVLSLSDFGVDATLVKVDSEGQLDQASFEDSLARNPLLLSVHHVNNITGALLPVEELAREAKTRCPKLVFHTDAVQSFGKVRLPNAASVVDLVSLSSHKVAGPKGVGALIVLNRKLLNSRAFRPLLWGGEQESGWRSGTQNAGLIAAFHHAARETLHKTNAAHEHAWKLRLRLREQLQEKGLLATEPKAGSGQIRWNSPENAIPQIVNISVPGFSGGPLARLLEERGYLVATGSACSSKKPEPDPTLSAMGLPAPISTSALRISFSQRNDIGEIDGFVDAIKDAIGKMRLLGGVAR